MWTTFGNNQWNCRVHGPAVSGRWRTILCRTATPGSTIIRCQSQSSNHSKVSAHSLAMDCYENKVRLHCVVIIIHYICSYVNTFTPVFFFLSFPLLWSASVASFFGGAQSKRSVTVQHHVFSFMMTSLSSAISPRCPRTCLTLTRLILPASFDSNNFTTISLVFHSISLHKGRRFVSFAHSKVVILALRQVLTFYVYILTYIHTYVHSYSSGKAVVHSLM